MSQTNLTNPVAQWIEHRLPVFSFIQHSMDYRTPRNLSYWWNFGSIALVCLIVQVLTGIFLVMNYAAHTHMAFDSVERIMRDVNYGWLLRYTHANGASMFFIAVYIHMVRGLYYGSYKAPRELVWMIGVVIMLLMMATAFMGYVLPWGQMSFWGATVITNLFSAFPLVGESIVTWLWGGFSVDNPTLNRFFSLHYLLPFVLIGVVVVHIIALHRFGSNNPLGIDVKQEKDTIPFHPYYTIKDYLGLSVFFLFFSYFIFFAPNMLGHPDNYTEANPLVTPAHIVPEWYFLPFYAILRAVTMDLPLWLPGLALLGGSVAVATCEKLRVMLKLVNKKAEAVTALALIGSVLVAAGAAGMVIESKLGGVLSMFGAIAVLFVLPWLDSSPVRSGNYRPLMRIFFVIFVLNAILLGYAGSQSADWGTILGFVTAKDIASANGVSLGWMTITLPESMQHLADLLPDVKVSALSTLYYFAYFLVILPILPRFEKTKPLPTSIAGAVLGNKA